MQSHERMMEMGWKRMQTIKWIYGQCNLMQILLIIVSAYPQSPKPLITFPDIFSHYVTHHYKKMWGKRMWCGEKVVQHMLKNKQNLMNLLSYNTPVSSLLFQMCFRFGIFFVQPGGVLF